MEPSWLYLDNRYLQYANALCAAAELRQAGNSDTAPFDSLPDSFRRSRERNQSDGGRASRSVSAEAACSGRAAPGVSDAQRSGAEFSGQGSLRRPLGQLTYSQVLREAYPGSIYYYMARPYRVYRYRYRDGRWRYGVRSTGRRGRWRR